MANNITADDILAAPASRPISAQDVIDAVPVDRKLQPQLRSGDTPISPLDIEYANSPNQIPPNLNVTQDPTGPDQNVLKGSAGFKGNFKAGFVEDPQTKIRILSAAMFPNDPNAAQRFGIRDGKVVYIDDDMNVRDVDSGLAATVGNVLAYTPEAVGSVVGSFASGNPASGSAIGGVGGKAVKQIIAGTLFDEPQTTAGNLEGMAKEGVVNLATAGLGKGAGKVLDKSRVVDFTPAARGGAEAVRDTTARSTGITLDLAQASGDPQLMALRKYAAKFPGESSQIFKALDELQTSQSADAMQRLIGTVTKAMSSDAAGRQGINAAQEAIRAARASVSKQVKPLYDAAYAAVPEVTDQKIIEMLKLPFFEKAYRSGQKLAKLEGVDTTKPSLQLMDYTKRTLDDQIESLIQSGNRQAARALKLKRDEFVAALDAIPNQQWQSARQAYGQLAKSTIEPLENGAVGVLARIKDAKAATAAAKIINDPAVTPGEILSAKTAISKADPEAWQALSGQYLAGVLDKALKVSQRGESVNLAGKLYQALAGTPQQLAKVRAALPQGAQQQFTEMLGALKLVAATERAGSDTAFNQLITRKIEGRFSTALKWLRQPVQTAIQSGEERSLDKLVGNLARGLTDPASISSLKQVSKYPPGVQRGLLALSNVAAGTGLRVLEGEVNPLPDQPIGEPRRGRPRSQQSQGQ